MMAGTAEKQDVSLNVVEISIVIASLRIGEFVFRIFSIWRY